VINHESDLLAVLEKVGQRDASVSVDASVPAVVDAETVVMTNDRPAPPPESVPVTQMVGAPVDRKLTPVTRKSLFVHHDTHPVVYDVALLQQYKTDWFSWEPETLWVEIKDDFHVPSIADLAKTKIQAIKTIHISESYWKHWEAFCWITQSLNNNIPDWHVLQKPTLSQLFNAVEIADVIRSGEVFSLEVSSFVAACFLEEGVLYAPHPLEFCQPEIERFLKLRNLEEQTPLIEAVQGRYRETLKFPEGTALHLQETPVDIQVAKLRVAWDYLSMRREQLKEQLRLLS
jgi:hypothetical protein